MTDGAGIQGAEWDFSKMGVMSQWRRVALEAVPSCKKAIEEARTPAQMWIRLYDELYSSNPAREVADKQIYEFALRCFRTEKPKALADAVWLFFHYVIGGYVVGNENLRSDLPGRIFLSDFQPWKEWIKSTFSAERYEEAVAQFAAAKRNHQMRD